MKKQSFISFRLLSASLFAGAAFTVAGGARLPLWPSLEKIPDFQPHQIGAMTDEAKTNADWRAAHRMPYIEWCDAPATTNGGIMITLSGGSYQCCCDVGLVKTWQKRFT